MSNMDNEGQGASQETVDTSVANESGTEQVQEGGSSQDNPAWNDLLGIVPEMLHSQVKPHLQQWDKNYQDGIQKVHSQYASYKPYLDAGIDSNQINYALQVMQAMESRPAEVIAALQEAYPELKQAQQEAQGENTGEQGQDNVPDFLQHPDVMRRFQAIDTMAQIMVQQNQINQQSAEDQALSAELDELQDKFKAQGGFDEEWVLTRAANNPQVPMEDHVKAYIDFRNGLIAESRRPNAPRVLGSGGNAPDSKVDFGKLSDKDRRSAVAQMLEAAARNND